MAVSCGSSSLSLPATSSLSSSSRRLSRCVIVPMISSGKGFFDGHQPTPQHVATFNGSSSQSLFGALKAKLKHRKWQTPLFTASEDYSSKEEITSDASGQKTQLFDREEFSQHSISSLLHFERTVGKPGFISFHGRDSGRQDEILEPALSKKSDIFWFIGPFVLVASFIFPSLYLRRIVSSVFEDSLLMDFLILFFTEALFYCGVAIYLLLIDHLQKPSKQIASPMRSRSLTTQLVHRISSVAALVLSLIIPMVTMGLVWPWTGPAASATLAPYLVGIVVQFAFEQYARYLKSPSWPAIPLIFQVYRLHQLNRAAQLVTALSFTVRGAETTSHILAINSSLATLLNVLQFLGVICIWSLASFLMKFLPSATVNESWGTQ